MEFSIAVDGDKLEQYACKIGFLPTNFSSYEIFWKSFIVPLTYRDIDRRDIRLRQDKDLTYDEGESHARICIASLHYSVLSNLLISLEIKDKIIDYSDSGVGLVDLNHFFVNLFAAVDIAHELIIRHGDLNKREFNPWNDDDSNLIKERREFQRSEEPTEIQLLRKYRDRLVHGRLIPGFSEIAASATFPQVPSIGKEKAYLDWRKVTNQYIEPEDFERVPKIMDIAFNDVTKYLESLWKKHLISA